MPSLEDLIRPKDVALRLPLSFDPDRLAADLDRMEQNWWHAHLGPYHDGNWQAIALWAPNGHRTSQFSRGGTCAAAVRLHWRRDRELSGSEEPGAFSQAARRRAHFFALGPIAHDRDGNCAFPRASADQSLGRFCCRWPPT